jgi:hypothetical protein
MGKADGAHTWARVLSELANVPVTVNWERPAWRVHWQDGPTRQALADRGRTQHLPGRRTAARRAAAVRPHQLRKDHRARLAGQRRARFP